MPRIFISYRRADTITISGRIYDRLVQHFGVDNVFKDVDKIPLGTDFRSVIADEISQADVMLVIIGSKWLNIRTGWLGRRRLSDPNDAVRIEVEAGLERGDNLLVVPLLVNRAGMPAALDLPPTIRPLSYKNAAVIRDDPDFNRDMNRLIEALDKWFSRSASARTIDVFVSPTPTEQVPIHKPPSRFLSPLRVGIFAVSLVLIVSILVALSTSNPPTVNPTFDPFDAANRLLTHTAEAVIAALATPTPNPSATIEAILTGFAVGTHQAEIATADAYTDTPTATLTPSDTATANFTATAHALETVNAQSTTDALAATNAQATNNALATQDAPTNTPQPIPTNTSAPTPTPTFTATLAFPLSSTLTLTASIEPTKNATAAAQALLDAQATVSSLSSSTPYSSSSSPLIGGVSSNQNTINLRSGPSTNNAVLQILSRGTTLMILEMTGDGAWFHVQLVDGTQGYVASTLLTIIGTATPTPTPIATPKPLPTPDSNALTLAHNGVTTNENWIPVMKNFDSVDMVLVPAGCFFMGSSDGNLDEQPVNRQCFGSPFWIDRTEVTNKQFSDLGGQAASPGVFSGDNRPRESITWFEARDYCDKLGGRLPTEAEWEYTARGPDSLNYPWGDDFNGYSAVYDENSIFSTSDVGSLLSGASWVGALDMSGNVWEWISSIYLPYPYLSNDGRENMDDNTKWRLVRGGSWTDKFIFMNAAIRTRLNPTLFRNNLGFRCARDFTSP